MSITDFATLKEAVVRWAGGSSDPEFPDAIDDAIPFTEADLNTGFISPEGKRCRGLRVPEMIKRSTTTVNQRYELLPNDFLEVRAVNYVTETGDENPLAATNEERIAYADRMPGLPRLYALSGRQIRVAPRPGEESFRIRLTYYAKCDPLLTDPNACTAILQTYPQVYLHGILSHLEGYLVDDPRIVTWKAQFYSAVIGANTATAHRSGPYAA